MFRWREARKPRKPNSGVGKAFAEIDPAGIVRETKQSVLSQHKSSYGIISYGTSNQHRKFTAIRTGVILDDW